MGSNENELIELVHSESKRLLDAIGMPWKNDDLRTRLPCKPDQQIAEGTWHIEFETDLATGHFLVEVVPKRWIQVPLEIRRLLNGKTMLILFGVRHYDFKGGEERFIEFVKEELIKHESQGIL